MTDGETTLVSETHLGKYQVEARVGDAALLVDPLDVQALAAALARALADTIERRRMIEAGRLQVQRFSWETAARQLMAHYTRLLG